MTAEETIDDLAVRLGMVRYRWTNEDDLQRGIEHQLHAIGFPFEREVILGARTERVDFLVHVGSTNVGIEVKVGGSFALLARQAHRYAISGRIHALLVVTAKSAHAALPTNFGGVPMRVLLIGGLRC